MYEFIEGIKEKEYRDFILKNSQTSFMQDPSWGKVKKSWKNILCGVKEKRKLKAVFSILIKPLPLGKTLFYIPRGYVVDFTDISLLKFITKEVFTLAKKYHAYAVKIDPNFCCSEKSILEITKDEPVEIPLSYSNNYQEKHENLLLCGYIHKGFKKNLSDYLQPRYQMAIPLIDKNFNFLNIEDVKQNFNKRIRNHFDSYLEKRGVYFYHTNDIKFLDEFIKVINETEKRQNINLRNYSYFENIMKNYKENAHLFFGEIDLLKYQKFLEETKASQEEIDMVNSYINEGKTTITSTASLVILPPNKDGIRTSEYLYAGNNLLIPKLRVSNALIYEICKFSLENNCHYCNLGGVSGNFDDHLTTFKSKFNPIVLEFIGEYDLVINKWLYYLIEKFLPILKKIYKKIRK